MARCAGCVSPTPSCKIPIIIGSTICEDPNQLLDCADYVCDGVDDQVEIQAAIDFIIASPFSHTLFFLPCGYSISAPIDPKGVVLESGFSQQAQIFTNFVDGVRVIDTTDFVVMQNINISAKAACAIRSESGCFLQNVGMVGGGGAGDDESMLLLTTASQDCFIDKCTFFGLPGGGLAITILAGGNGLSITNNSIRFNGIQISDYPTGGTTSPSGKIQNNFFYALEGSHPGIQLERCDNMVISNNQFYDAANEGIVLIDTNRTLITGNQILDSMFGLAQDGIQLSGDSNENSIIGNRVRTFTDSGFHGRHGINIIDSTCDDNYVNSNDLLNSGQDTEFNDGGTNTRRELKQQLPPFSMGGAVVTSTSGRWYVPSEFSSFSGNLTIQASLGTAGTSNTTAVVLKNGSSIGSVTLGSGVFTNSTIVSVASLVPSDYLQLQTTAAGTGAMDLVVQVY